ncbi:hypothetical protein J2W28_001622 [Variovorax boronicumulans]|nr:hypothetical protein [Variovorax boronicumulans]MDQ0002482.1 hypothetical protein [Variovorax boronicumulans]
MNAPRLAGAAFTGWRLLRNAQLLGQLLLRQPMFFECHRQLTL